MSNEREHVDFDTMNDMVDGRLDEPRLSRVREHLAGCVACMAEHERLTALLRFVSDLPKSVLPSEDIWPDLKKQLDSGKSLMLPSRAGVGSVAAGNDGGRSSWLRSAPFLAAAGLLLVVLSSGITALVLRGGDRFASIPADQRQGRQPVLAAHSVLPVGFRQTEVEYTRTIQELQLAVDAQRGRLSPETVQIVEQSLVVVDSAIAEARAALIADPNDRVLVDLLSANYQRKLDLLRRASELGSRT